MVVEHIVVDHRSSCITAGGAVVAQIERRGGDLTSEEVNLLLDDDKGSVESVVPNDGTPRHPGHVLHDPMGNRFDLTNGPILAAAPVQSFANVTKGFTGHEMEIEDLGLINMNGRMFDPGTGTFLSVDPFVSMPDSAQGYNRFMYVAGRLTTMIDPSGYVGATVESTNYYERYRYDSRLNGNSSSGNRLSPADMRRISAENQMMAQAQYLDGVTMGRGYMEQEAALLARLDLGGGRLAAAFDLAKAYIQSGGEVGVSADGKAGAIHQQKYDQAKADAQAKQNAQSKQAGASSDGTNKDGVQTKQGSQGGEEQSETAARMSKAGSKIFGTADKEGKTLDREVPPVSRTVGPRSYTGGKARRWEGNQGIRKNSSARPSWQWNRVEIGRLRMSASR